MTQLIAPTCTHPLEIRCDAADAIVANLAMNVVFFFKRHLDARALRRSFARAIGGVPVFAGRMAMGGAGMRIRCGGQGVPFTVMSSGRTLHEAITSTSEDSGRWLVDPVNGVAARWGWGPLCTVRITHLADDSTAIGISWHHAIGDMQTLMYLMGAWTAAARGEPFAVPLIVEDRAAYLDEHLPADGAARPGVRRLGLAEIARGAGYLVRDARKLRSVRMYFGDDELARMRDAYSARRWLSTNEVVCAHVCEALMRAQPEVDRRTLALVVNVRTRCNLDPMLVGNIVTTTNVDLRRGQPAASIAEDIRHHLDRFTDEDCDMRANQRFMDAAGAWGALRCVTGTFNLRRWNPLITNLTRFGVHRLEFGGTPAYYWTLLMTVPVPGFGALMEGADGQGLVFQMLLPPGDFEAMSTPSMRAELHRFQRADDEIPRLHRELHV
ncbi:acyltransferase [Mycobacterium sp. GA-2829]|uniref:acyltransferase n=1 Tax=Mycobacterium sp. GA-2829 TaxID=1772283 RepID=UPI0012FC3EE2|nr:acyltransferase [Mycobacterium sp. GA-2829]